MRLALAGLCFAWLAAAQTVPFRTEKAGEVVVSVTAKAANTDWEQSGREAAVLDVTIDQGRTQQVVLYAGSVAHTYKFFVGELPPGAHELRFSTNTQQSAAGAGTVTATQWRFQTVTPGTPEYAALAHAPILFARRNTVGRFSDVPLLVYAELTDKVLQYTVIFSNEDGGTSTRALMARWGRTTDIEYVYRGPLNASGEIEKAIIQGRNHQDIEFQGQTEGRHPLLVPITDNNMVGPVNSAADTTPLRFQIAPQLVDLSQHSREQVMDDNPISYRISAKEMAREGKIRPYGAVEGEKIGDVRQYVTIEMKGRQETGALAVWLRRKSGSWQSGALGRPDYAISRPGWVRTTVEMPPGTPPGDISEIGFECLAVPTDIRRPLPLAGTCEVESVSKVFPLTSEGLPGPSLWRSRTPFAVPSGQMLTFPIP